MKERETLGLDRVHVNRDVLIKQIEHNKTVHESEYVEALDAWKKLVTARLREMYEKARDGVEYTTAIRDLPKPINHSQDYAEALSMLKASIDTHLVLTSREFHQYWNDKWSWQHDHELVKGYSTAVGRIS